MRARRWRFEPRRSKIARAAAGRTENKEIDMGSKHTLIAIAAVTASLAWQVAAAQASAPSRADVKAETRAGEKAGTLARPGELGGPAAGTSEGSGAKVTRAERKKATR
jgi:hypothetical protein